MRRLGHDHTADGRTANRYRTVRLRHAPPPRLSLGSLATPDAPGVSFSHDLGWAGKLLVLLVSLYGKCRELASQVDAALERAARVAEALNTPQAARRGLARRASLRPGPT